MSGDTVVLVLALAVALAGFFLFRAATDKPMYPGFNAPRAGQVAPMGPPPGTTLVEESPLLRLGRWWPLGLAVLIAGGAAVALRRRRSRHQ
jgi:hypothetical protein